MNLRNLRPGALWLLNLALLAAPAIVRAQQTASTPAQQNQSTSQPSGASQVDPAKAAAIHQLLEVTGGIATITQVMDGMQQNLKGTLNQMLPPGEYRQQLVDLYFQKFRSEADPQYLLNLAARVYDKYLTLEDIQGLIQFYSTPLGKKTLTVLPKLTIEVQTQSMQWGQELGRKAMIEVLTEHPDLAKAMQDAARNTSGSSGATGAASPQ
jgi:hypothetical protein